MTDGDDRELQDWFASSRELPSAQRFTALPLTLLSSGARLWPLFVLLLLCLLPLLRRRLHRSLTGN